MKTTGKQRQGVQAAHVFNHSEPCFGCLLYDDLEEAIRLLGEVKEVLKRSKQAFNLGDPRGWRSVEASMDNTLAAISAFLEGSK